MGDTRGKNDSPVQNFYPCCNLITQSYICITNFQNIILARKWQFIKVKISILRGYFLIFSFSSFCETLRKNRNQIASLTTGPILSRGLHLQVRVWIKEDKFTFAFRGNDVTTIETDGPFREEREIWRYTLSIHCR